MKKIILLFLMLFAVLGVEAQKYDAHCEQILDCAGNPIVGVIVHFSYWDLGPSTLSHGYDTFTDENGYACLGRVENYSFHDYDIDGYHEQGNAWVPNISVPVTISGVPYHSINPLGEPDELNFCSNAPVYCGIDELELAIPTPQYVCLRKSIAHIKNEVFCTPDYPFYSTTGALQPGELDDGLYVLFLNTECCSGAESKLPYFGNEWVLKFYFRIQSSPNIDWEWTTSFASDDANDYSIYGYNDPSDGLEPDIEEDLGQIVELGWSNPGINFEFIPSTNIDQTRIRLKKCGDESILYDSGWTNGSSGGVTFNSVQVSGTFGYFFSIFFNPNEDFDECYTVCVEAKGTCGEAAHCRSFTLKDSNPFNGDNPSGMGEYEGGTTSPINRNLKVYPNPTMDQLTISQPIEIKAIEIFDNLGKLVKTINNVSQTNKEIDISHLSEGIYHIRTIDINNKEALRKFVKQ